MTNLITDEQVARALGYVAIPASEIKIPSHLPQEDAHTIQIRSADGHTICLDCGELPPYTTSVDTAIKYLVPKMREKGYLWTAERTTNDDWVLRFAWWSIGKTPGYANADGWAEIKDDSPQALAMAMCQSAFRPKGTRSSRG